jgi:hypothetical protein
MYTLAEIRKILEQTGTTPAYPVLDFYTNWVVHSALDSERRLDEPRQAIPRHGCIPVEPASVSPGEVL